MRSLQAITYQGDTVATAAPTEFYLCAKLEQRPRPDPDVMFVAAMCLYAREILNGDRPEPYTDQDAARYARAFLIPHELIQRSRLDCARAAGALCVPELELQAAYDEYWCGTGHPLRLE